MIRKTSSPNACTACKGNGRVLEYSEFSTAQVYLSGCPRCFGSGTTNRDKHASWRLSDSARQEAVRDQELALSVAISGTCSGTPGRYYVEVKK